MPTRPPTQTTLTTGHVTPESPSTKYARAFAPLRSFRHAAARTCRTRSNTLQLIRTAGISSVDTQLKAYVNWVHHVQQDSDPNGIDVRGEPKVGKPCTLKT